MILELFRKLTVIIYDFFISNFLTISAHKSMLPYMNHLSGSFLDVGCGTGAPLQKIVPELRKHYKKIVGVDLNNAYTQQAQRIFEKDEDISIYNMNFYDINTVLKEKFNFIFFSFSFMLMPDPIKALQVAKEGLAKNGTISFMLTLNRGESSLLEKVKPFIRRITSIDFGKVVYQKQFEEILNIGNLQITEKVRITSKFNLLLRIFPVYYIEAKVRKQ